MVFCVVGKRARKKAKVYSDMKTSSAPASIKMTKIRNPTSMEILYVLGSNKDKRGRRVLVKEGITENVIYQAEEVNGVDMKLLGLTQTQRKQIESFLRGPTATPDRR